MNKKKMPHNQTEQRWKNTFPPYNNESTTKSGTEVHSSPLQHGSDKMSSTKYLQIFHMEFDIHWFLVFPSKGLFHCCALYLTY